MYVDIVEYERFLCSKSHASKQAARHLLRSPSLSVHSFGEALSLLSRSPSHAGYFPSPWSRPAYLRVRKHISTDRAFCSARSKSQGKPESESRRVVLLPLLHPPLPPLSSLVSLVQLLHIDSHALPLCQRTSRAHRAAPKPVGGKEKERNALTTDILIPNSSSALRPGLFPPFAGPLPPSRPFW
jgi:hypothetical protein